MNYWIILVGAAVIPVLINSECGVFGMSEFWKTVLMFLFGAGGLALINVIQERWKMRYQRKADKEDKQSEREDKLNEISKKLGDYIGKQEEYNQKTSEKLTEMELGDQAQSEALKYVLLDRILYIGQSYIKKGEVSFDDRKRLREMYDVYHKKPEQRGLGGNGDAQHIMDAVDALPLKQ